MAIKTRHNSLQRASSLVAYWPFDEGSGDTLRDLKNGYDMTISLTGSGMPDLATAWSTTSGYLTLGKAVSAASKDHFKTSPIKDTLLNTRGKHVVHVQTMYFITGSECDIDGGSTFLSPDPDDAGIGFKVTHANANPAVLPIKPWAHTIDTNLKHSNNPQLEYHTDGYPVVLVSYVAPGEVVTLSAAPAYTDEVVLVSHRIVQGSVKTGKDFTISDNSVVWGYGQNLQAATAKVAFGAAQVWAFDGEPKNLLSNLEYLARNPRGIPEDWVE